jgi:hypothetical protein
MAWGSFILGAVVGVAVMRCIGWILAERGPKPPGCKAVLRSGERCFYQAGHEGYHKAAIHRGQGIVTHRSFYAWEDPTCGVHSAGFF